MKSKNNYYDFNVGGAFVTSRRIRGEERRGVPFSQQGNCSVVVGSVGAVSSGHPLATTAALKVLLDGGSAVDAAIAAQAVICVVMPHAAGIGGDMLALVRDETTVTAVNGVGRSSAISAEDWKTEGGSSVTVPGLATGWLTLHEKWGRIPLRTAIDAAVELARTGFPVDPGLIAAANAQRSRLSAYGAQQWPLLNCAIGQNWRQPQLAELLETIGNDSTGEKYKEAIALPVAGAVEKYGGTLAPSDIHAQFTIVDRPLHTRWGGQTLWVQPPSSQGILLAMAAQWLDKRASDKAPPSEHLLAELTDAVFCHRDDVSLGEKLLKRALDVDPERASNRGGARAYLHTAGVAVADASGTVISSLVSVFDDFGSAIYVPEWGFVLNNRAAGFTQGLNAARASSFPVHTLAPAMLTGPGSEILAMATPGADGQVQTLIQILARLRFDRISLSEAIAAPRWRSQDRQLLIEDNHPARAHLIRAGHQVVTRQPGDDIFGAVVSAGFHDGPWAAGDWRRKVSSGAH
jgi:gamma-glutamyltranspeptidase/glutathione hydrolase